jgi:hypothetical protein
VNASVLWHDEDNDGCHSHNWLDLGEMRVVADAYRQPTEDYPDGDRSGLWCFLDVCVGLMEYIELNLGRPTRAVFCFDN